MAEDLLTFLVKRAQFPLSFNHTPPSQSSVVIHTTHVERTMSSGLLVVICDSSFLCPVSSLDSLSYIASNYSFVPRFSHGAVCNEEFPDLVSSVLSSI